MANILVVDDEEKIRKILRIMLQLKGHKVDTVSNAEKALSLIKENYYDLVIADIKMEGMSGLDLLKEIKKLPFYLPVIFITAYASIESAVEAMRVGAIDYIPKPFDEERIHLTIERTLGISKILSEKKFLEKELDKVFFPEDIVCVSNKMKEVLSLVQKVASKRDTTVLITGESGTGKEVVARYLHKISPRSHKRFLAINCAAIPQNLVESELFGHEKGAFTGANCRKKGVFEICNGGTVFLDEIGDLPIEVQAKFLRVLQEKKIFRVGGTEEISIDIRIIAATNQDLKKLVEAGKFREDLYYRLNVFPIYLPPLRERKEDIIPLVKYFIKKFTEKDPGEKFLTPAAQKILLDYHYPGNVRELANAVERALILSNSKLPLEAEHFSFLVVHNRKLSKFVIPPEGINLEELEKDLIKQALNLTGGNQSAAARLLGLTRSKFRTRLKLLEK